MEIVGREGDVARALEALGSARACLLWGAPGVGKSTVARMVVDAWRARGGAIERVELDDPDAPSIDARLDGLASDARLVFVSRRRQRAPRVTCLEIAPLSLGDDRVEISTSPAMRLFLASVRGDGGEAIASDDPRAATVVRALDGLPGALVVAAQRLDLFGSTGLARALERDRDAVLDVAGDALRRSIAAAWRDLDDVERRALMRLGLFDAAASIDALRALFADLTDDPLALVERLREGGWLRRRATSSGAPIFAALSIVRAHARLEARALDVAAAAERACVTALAAIDRGVESRVEVSALEVALDLALAHAMHDEAVTLALLIDARGPGATHAARHVVRLDRVLEAHRSADARRARLLRARGRARATAGAIDAALDDFDRALAIPSDDDGARRSELLIDAGVAHHSRRDLEAARRCYGEALESCRARGDRRGEGRVVGNLGALAHDLGERDEALAHYREALAIFTSVDERRLAAITLSNFGALDHEWGALVEARQHHERAIALAESVGDVRFAAIAIGNLGALLLETGARDEARARVEEALGLARSIGDPRTESLCLGRLGAISALDDRLDDSVRAFDDGDALARRGGDEVARATLAVQRAFLDLARARRARAEGHAELARAHVDEAKARSRTDLGELPDDARAALRILLPLLDPAASNADDELLLGPEASWFQVRGALPQDLGQRRPLRAILSLLVARRLARAPAATIDDLREAAWPGEKMSLAAAVNRVQVAIAELRKRGLRSAILRDRVGYRLDETVKVRRLETALDAPNGSAPSSPPRSA